MLGFCGLGLGSSLAARIVVFASLCGFNHWFLSSNCGVVFSILCFFRVTAVRFWEKFCGSNFCLGALKMEEKGKELKFEYFLFCLSFCLLENRTYSFARLSYTF